MDVVYSTAKETHISNMSFSFYYTDSHQNCKAHEIFHNIGGSNLAEYSVSKLRRP